MLHETRLTHTIVSTAVRQLKFYIRLKYYRMYHKKVTSVLEGCAPSLLLQVSLGLLRKSSGKITKHNQPNLHHTQAINKRQIVTKNSGQITSNSIFYGASCENHKVSIQHIFESQCQKDFKTPKPRAIFWDTLYIRFGAWDVSAPFPFTLLLKWFHFISMI